jgi:hypothetical protein
MQRGGVAVPDILLLRRFFGDFGQGQVVFDQSFFHGSLAVIEVDRRVARLWCQGLEGQVVLLGLRGEKPVTKAEKNILSEEVVFNTR